jgi:type IV secretion system protein TrbL
MNAEILNLVTETFNGALDAAFAALHVYSLGLLSVLGLMHLLLALGRLTAQGGTANLAALGEFLWVALRIGVFVFLVVVLDLIMDAAFLTFLQWGVDSGNGGFSMADFLNPSQTVDAGFAAAKPLLGLIRNMIGIGMVWNMPTLFTYSIAYWIIVISFGLMALHVIMTLIEPKLAIATSAVLVPWGVMTQTAFLGELSLSWLTACFVRVLLTAALMAISFPLFELVTFPGGNPAEGGSDPKIYQAVVAAIVAIVFAVLAWVLPSRAASIGGRGMALALGGDALVIHGGMVGVSAARYAAAAGQTVIRGVSEMLPQRRAA